MPKPTLSGWITSFDAEQQSGQIHSPELSGEVAVTLSVLDGPEVRELHPGQPVEFRLHETLDERAGRQAAWVRPLPYRGRVKFYKAAKGWGGIESEQTPGDVWVHFSVIAATGYRELTPGATVEFLYETANQDSWRYRATWVRQLSDEGEPKD